MSTNHLTLHTFIRSGTLPAVGLGKVYRNLEIYLWSRDGFLTLGPSQLLDHDDGLTLVFKYPERQLSRDWINASKESLWAALQVFIEASIKWKAAGLPTRTLDPRGFFFTNQGELLIVPPQTIDYLSASFLDTDKLPFLPLVHPDRTGEASWTFFLGVLLHKIFKDRWPWEGSEETVHQLIRERSLPTSRLLMPTLIPDLGVVFDHAMSGKVGFAELGKWRDLCTDKTLDQVTRGVSDLDVEKSHKEAQKLFQNTERHRKIKDWLRRQRLALILSGAALVFLFVIFGVPALQGQRLDPWKDALPELLVRTYYEAVNTLEDRGLEKMKGPGLKSQDYQGDVQETSFLHMFNEGRKVTLGDSGLISAQEWMDQGKPNLLRGKNLYGVAGLEIEELDQDSFKVTYEKWVTSDQGDVKTWQAWAVTDFLDFVLTPQGYKLDRLERKRQLLNTGR